MSHVDSARFAEIESAFHEFVMREQFPCLGARATISHDAGMVRVFGGLGDASNTELMRSTLTEFGERAKSEQDPFLSLIAVFPDTPSTSEAEFDALLWRQLEQLRCADTETAAVVGRASDDPEDPHFSFRFGGVPYFVVGLSPVSSRMARRFSWPTLVFNPHSVFERLRAEGKYDKLKARIRERDMALQGSLNPNLADFGEVSEARQYSGMVHEAEWKCPFHKKGS